MKESVKGIIGKNTNNMMLGTRLFALPQDNGRVGIMLKLVNVWSIRGR